MTTLSIAAALALVEKHMKYLDSLLENLSRVNPPFDELVIVASGLRPRSSLRLRQLVKSFPVPVRIVDVPLLPLGLNRNLGWLATNCDVVCFIDSDDLYSPRYRSEIERLFVETRCDVVLHSFVPLESRDLSSSQFPEIEKGIRDQGLLMTVDLLASNRLGAERDREAELKRDGTLSRLLVPDWWRYEVHQGHASVRRSAVERVHYILELGQRNEDGVFIKDCLEASLNVVVSPEALSCYSLHTSAIYWDSLRVKALRERLLEAPRRVFKKVFG